MSSPPDLHEVRLLAVPVQLRARSKQHGEELVREMTLISQQSDEGEADTLPRRLVEVAREVRTSYGSFTAKADEQFEAALARGDEVVDEITYAVPQSVRAFVQHLVHILEEADAYCRSGQHLLTLATPPDVAAYRRWTLGEFDRQLAGAAATPWPEFAATPE